ncbi:MAG: hypothetical protein HYX49_02615 [Chloroflexi bacterium]|nr:hypothetical protein [Chloroflexota bacterium]
MKNLFYLILLMAFLLSACGGNAAPTQTQAPATQSPSTQTPLPVTQPSDKAASPTPEIVNPPDCTNSAAFVTDVTIPDNTNLKQGEKFSKVWRVKNTGACTWTPEYKLVFYDGDQMGAPSSVPLSVTRPGDTLDISVDMTAPIKDSISRADFELHTPLGAAMPIDKNTLLWVIITVGNAGSAGGGSNGTGSGSGSANGSASGAGLVTSTCAFVIDQPRVNQTVASINAYRAQNNLPAYTVDPDLVTAAQSHSADIACNNLFIHTGSNGSTPASRVAATGYVASALTENIYGSYPPLTAQDAVTWWATDQVDPRHNENLLSTKYTQIGVGYAFFNNFGYYVIDFAAP